MNKVILLVVLIMALGLLGSCSPVPPSHIQEKGPVEVYDSAFPNKNDSKELTDIMNSVKRINSTVYYSTFLFSQQERITKEEIGRIDLKKSADRVVNTNQSSSGTATIIYKDQQNIALLTCAHILTFPDTVISYYKRADLSETEYVRSVSIKIRQVNIVLALPDLGYFKIIAMDTQSDLALLGVRVDQFSNQHIPVLSIPMGDPSELQWASFVYVIGYPQGYKMITRALVSEPDRDAHDSFIMDALFNRGFSGGLVVAVKGGVPNFEWVGIANSATAKVENILQPDERAVGKYDAFTPYRDPIYLGRSSQIKYGITHAISVNRVRHFFRDYNRHLEKEGYDFSYFLK